METGDSSKCDPRDSMFSSLSRDMINHELPSLSPVSIIDGHLMVSTGFASKSTKIWGSGIIVHLPLPPTPHHRPPVPQAQTRYLVAWTWHIYLLYII